MTPPEVGFLDSLAWRVGDRVHVSLHLPAVEPAETVEVRFRDGERRVRVPGRVSAADEGSMVDVEVPARRVAGGLWRIAVRLGDAESFTRVEARLLVRPDQPIALLPGPAPRTRMPEPPARDSRPAVPAGPRVAAARLVRSARRRLTR